MIKISADCPCKASFTIEGPDAWVVTEFRLWHELHRHGEGSGQGTDTHVTPKPSERITRDRYS